MADSVTESTEEVVPKYYISQANENDRMSWRVYERRGKWGGKPTITGLSKTQAEAILESLLSDE